MRARKIKQRLGLTLAALVVTGTALFAVLRAEAGIAVWAPPSMTQITTSANHSFSCGIADGKAYCWGENDYGQLGNDSTSATYTPVAVDTSGVLAGKSVLSISAGSQSVCVIASDNNAYCWGLNDYGQLGNNSTAESHVPVSVTTSGVLSGKKIKTIAAGLSHVCAIASDNNAYCWGSGAQGRLGNSSNSDSYVPVAVYTSGVLSSLTIKTITAGYSSTCVVASNDNAYCWGYNGNGQLGDNTNTDSNVPVAVYTAGVLSGKTIKSISGKYRFVCAVASDNNAYCWGQNGYGQLGDNSTTSSSVAVAVSTTGVLSGKTILSVSAGYNHTCAIASDNNAYCWGRGGALGDGTNTQSSIPVAVSTSGVLSGKTVRTLSSGINFTCAIASDGHAYCWGANANGQLGDNSTTQRKAPVAVLFSATFNAPNYRLYYNANSSTPAAPLTDINTPATLGSYGQAFRVRMGVKTEAQVGGLAVGGSTSCALSDGKAWCWGVGEEGEIGDGNAIEQDWPTAVDMTGVLAGKSIRNISVGTSHVCVIASDQKAYCWGDNSSGQLGDNTTTQRNTPVAVTTSGVLSGKTILSISVGGYHTCVIASDNNAYCWGDNSSGQLGDNSTTQRNTPVAVTTSGVLSGKTILSISAGDTNTCVVASDNNAYCWGNNDDGKLGDNSTTQRNVPAAVYTAGVLSGKTIKSIAPGLSHTCAIASDNNAYCWGWNYFGQLGDNTNNASSVPVAVNTAGVLSGKTVTSIAVGHVNGFSSCAIASDGNAYCWGDNGIGQLGNNSTINSSVPVAVDTSGVLSGKTVSAVSMGEKYACLLASDNKPYCFGRNYSGQLGDGSWYESATSPVATNVDYIPGADIPASANTYKLQYAQKTAGTCSAQTGFADVTANTPIAYSTNGGVSNGAAISATADDPVPTTDSVPQTYISAAGTFTNTSTITGGKTGLWDFSLMDSSGLYDTSYCLRMTYGDGTALEGTTEYPEVTTVAKKSVSVPATRFYQNADSATPGSPLAATNTTATLTSSGQAFRLRTGIKTAVTPALQGKTILSSSGGSYHTCVVASDNKAYCYGLNQDGQLGDGTTTDSTGPVAVDTSGVLAGKTVTQVAAGETHTCALTSEGKAYCWGDDAHHNEILGAGVAWGSSRTPIAVDTTGVLAGKTIQQIAVGRIFSCALTTEGKVYCWGHNPHGELGDNTTYDSVYPVAVDTSGVLAGKTVTKLSLGEENACVLTSDAAVYCWGANWTGGVGNGGGGSYWDVPTSIDMSGVLSGKTITDMSVGGAHACVLASDNKPYCWGYSSWGQLGNGTAGTNALSPVAVTTSGVLSGKTLHGIESGYEGTCVLDASNNAYCWGMGTHGELGNSASSDSMVPVAVTMTGALSGKTISTLDSGYGDLTTGAYSVCARTSDGGLYCWGANAYGQLGNGSTTDSNVAVALNTGLYDPSTYIGAYANSYKLQYAQKTAGTCSAQTGFADVTGSTAIAFNTNASVTNGATITSNANDPVAAADSVMQNYVSAGGTFTNGQPIPGGKTGLWDFSLKDNTGGLYNTPYCLRIAYGDGSALLDAIAFSELRTTLGILSVGFVDASDAPLSNPTIAFDNTTVSTTAWQQTYAALGSSTQKLRVYNDLATNGWSVSIAASSGPTALWDRSDHLAKYDFNDADGPVDGSDSDSLGGALAVMPQTSTITSGCSTSGLTRGSNNAFSEGSLNSITLLSASNTAAMGCNFDLTDTGLFQAIPAAQAQGTYTLDMTITVVAL